MARTMLASRLLSVAVAGVAGACTSQPEPPIERSAPEARGARFATAIREAGYLCDEVIEATIVEGARMAWRVVCNDALAYLVVIEGDDVRAEPMPYTDPVLRTDPRVRPTPEAEREEPPRPEP
jgi:hypothetical protein